MGRPAGTTKKAEAQELAPAAEKTQGKTYTAEEVQKIVDAAVAKAMAQKTPTTQDDRVMLLWQANVADDNVTEFGDHGTYGRITGKTGTFFVPKSELSRILDSPTRMYLERRWLIVVSGLDKAEREALGVDYREDEYLTKEAFSHLVELGDEIIPLYQKLCEGSQKIVASRFYEAWKDGSAYVTRDLVTKMKDLTKAMGNGEQTFKRILDEMNERDAEG